MNWQSLPQVKMGNIGEEIVTEYLISKGYIPYLPHADRAHPFDILCSTPDKKNLFVAEVKTKPARMYYPDTGFNIRVYNDYKHIWKKHAVDVFLFFVDTSARAISGNWLQKLETPTTILHNGKTLQYPLTQNGIIYFPIENMAVLKTLSDDEIAQIEQHTTRNYKY